MEMKNPLPEIRSANLKIRGRHPYGMTRIQSVPMKVQRGLFHLGTSIANIGRPIVSRVQESRIRHGRETQGKAG